MQNNIIKYIILLNFVLAHAMVQAQISLEKVITGAFTPQSVAGFTPLNDGESFTRMENYTIYQYSFKTGKMTGILCISEQKIDSYIISPDEKTILLRTNFTPIYRRSGKADYIVYSIEKATQIPLSNNGSQECPKFSPDGKKIAFVRDNNIFIVDLTTMKETQITNDGKLNHIINGKPDWVYEEEFSFNRAFDFSSDSKTIAWIRFNESEVKAFNFPLYKGSNPSFDELTLYPGTFVYKYPKAGEKNSNVDIFSYNLENQKTTKINIPLESEGYIPRIKFTDHPDKLGVLTLNRLQNHLEIFIANSSTGNAEKIFEEDANKYFDTDTYEDLDFAHDQFVLIDDKDGYKHLYLYNIKGELVKQLTSGNFDINNYYGCDNLGTTFFYSSCEGSPLEQYIYKTDIKGNKILLTKEKGYNSASFGKGCKYFVNNFSNIDTPPIFSVISQNGKQIRVIEDNANIKATYSDSSFGKTELFSFTTNEGVQLNGWMVKPNDFDPRNKYPVLMFQYSGPGSQQVQNSWSNGFFPGLIWEHRLSQKGIIVVCVDGRGTGCRGAEWKKCTYEHLFRKESKDQVETAIYLGSLSYVDKNRIAIWGWSYGGGNTLMSMSEGRGVFCCGIAVAPVTSYRFYDTIYTERYMGLPQKNEEGYDDNPISNIPKLHGDLLLCHGYADDNVHFQNMAEYTEALVEAGIQFESQFYVNRNHSISGGKTRLHLFKRIEAFLDSHLLK